METQRDLNLSMLLACWAVTSLLFFHRVVHGHSGSVVDYNDEEFRIVSQ